MGGESPGPWILAGSECASLERQEWPLACLAPILARTLTISPAPRSLS